MTNAVSLFPLRMHTNTTPFEEINKCWDAITQCVLNIFRQIADLFYNMLIDKPIIRPAQQIPPPVKEEELIVAASAPIEPIIINPVTYTRPWVDPRKVIAFYHGKPVPSLEITLEDILSADNLWLKNDHWLWAFPTRVPNKAVDFAADPVLDGDDFRAVLKDPIVRENILKVFRIVLAYFGLQLNDEHQIEKGSNFEERRPYWITDDNHNFPRITQIIRSLEDMQTYGRLSPRPEGYGKALVDCLKKISQENQAEMGKAFREWRDLAYH